jgi:hypothetical protein
VVTSHGKAALEASHDQTSIEELVETVSISRPPGASSPPAPRWHLRDVR